jgi:hypothetical protein
MSTRLLLPDVEGFGPGSAIRLGGQKLAAWMEVTMDKRVRGKEAPSLFRRFESFHLAFASSCWTV